jgi:hypothetical protein
MQNPTASVILPSHAATPPVTLAVCGFTFVLLSFVLKIPLRTYSVAKISGNNSEDFSCSAGTLPGTRTDS